jgi:hypothetical protein
LTWVAGEVWGTVAAAIYTPFAGKKLSMLIGLMMLLAACWQLQAKHATTPTPTAPGTEQHTQLM